MLEEKGTQLRIRVRDPSEFKWFTTKDPGRPGHFQIVGGPTFDNPNWQAQSYRFSKDEVRFVRINSVDYLVAFYFDVAAALRRIKRKFKLNYIVIYSPNLRSIISSFDILTDDEKGKILASAERRARYRYSLR